jgi:hypothetical protein
MQYLSADNVSDISDLLYTWQESLISEVEEPMKQFTVPSCKVNVWMLVTRVGKSSLIIQKIVVLLNISMFWLHSM